MRLCSTCVQTARTKPSSSNYLREKGDILYLKTSILGVFSNSYTSSIRYPMTHVLHCDVYLCCSTLDGA